MKKLGVIFAVLALLLAGTWYVSRSARMLLGGIFVDLAYWSQDGVEQFDAAHERLSPDEIWKVFLFHNDLASRVRKQFPRTPRHPVMAVVACMDGRLDTNEVMGDTRRFYYVVRTAGSVTDAKEEEMLELAVRNGVKIVAFTRHTDCAAEKTAADPEKSKLFPQLTRAIGERDMRIREFMARPFIRERIEKGELKVKVLDIDTMNEQAVPRSAL